MRKENLVPLFCLLLLTSCATSNSEYSVGGRLVVPMRTAYLCTDNGTTIDTLASCTLKDGKYRFEGTTPTPKNAYITYGEHYKYIPIVLENKNYKITTDILNIANTEYISNSEEQKIYEEYIVLEKLYVQKKDSSLAVLRKVQKSEIAEDIEAAKKGYYDLNPEQRELEDEFIKKYPDSYSALCISYMWRNDMPLEKLKDRMSLLGEKYSNDDLYKYLLKRISDE